MISLWHFVRNSGTHVFWWTQKPRVFWWTQIKVLPFQNLMSFDGPKTSCALMDPFFVSPPEPLISCLLVDPKGPSKHMSANLFHYHFFFSFSDVCPSSSDPNYRSFGSKCYYFESSPATYNDAQTACNSKIGTGGKLAEPSASVELYAFLYSTASSIVNNSGPYWIGIDDLQNNDGVFRYASTLSGRLWSF